MNNDTTQRDFVYSRPGKFYGNDAFDLRSGVIRSINDAKELVNAFQFNEEELAGGRNLVLPFWGSQEAIYIDWRIPADRRLTGTGIYKTEQVMKIEFPLFQFIHLAAQRPDFLGMVPMDISAKTELDRYAVQSRAFDLKQILNGIAVRA